MVKLETEIGAKRVTSADNTANALSRGERGELELQRKVGIKMPVDLNKYLKKM